MAADDRHDWRRSTRCAPTKNCVELARAGHDVVVRDSKSTATLHPFDDAGWTPFLTHCRALT
jgi:hypothetical protein